MNKTTAIAIVQSINPDINETLMLEMLESSKGTKNNQPAYRPYIVGARSLAMNPPQGDLKKADVAEWFDWERRINTILNSQLADDGAIDEIPIGWVVELGAVIPMAAMMSNGPLS